MKSTSRRTWASFGGKMPRPKSSVKSSSHHGFARGRMLGGSNFGGSSAVETACSDGAGAAPPLARFGGGGGFFALTFSASAATCSVTAGFASVGASTSIAVIMSTEIAIGSPS